jgi:hypothetical protein
MVILINQRKGILQKIPKELKVNSEDSESLVLSKIFLLEGDVLVKSLIRIVSRTSDSLTYEVGEIQTDDILRDPYAFNAVSNEKFKIYFKSFSRFKNLKPSELLRVATVKLYSTLPDMFQDLSYEVKDFLKSVKIVKQELYTQTAVIPINLSEKIKNSIIQRTENGKYVYSLLSSITDIRVAEEPLDANTVMKEIQLSKEVPLAHIVDPDTSKPLIKVWNGLPKEQLKTFLLLETKNLAGRTDIRRPRGLTFKVLNTSGEYLTVFLSKTSPRVSLRCNWNSEDTASFSDVKTYVKPIYPLINQIQEITGKSTKPEITIKYAKILCKIKQTGSIKNILKAHKASPNNLKLLNSSDSGLDFSVGVGGPKVSLRLIQADNSISVIVSGVKQETQLFEVLDSIVNLLNNTEGKTSQKKKIQTERPFAPKCSLERKPRVLNVNEVAKTYTVDSTFGKLTCNDNEKYQYPGYTSKGDICCFAKDQRKKPNFATKLNSRKIIFSDENVLSKPVIITDKLLQNGRIGIMPKIIAPHFSEDFNRLGTEDGSLLSAISYCGAKLTRKKLEENFNQQLADSLEISYTDTLRYIRSEKTLDHKKLLSIIQKIINKNVIVIAETSVFCDEVVDFEFKEFIVLYKNKANYEPLVKTINYKTLQKIFMKKDLLEFLKIYHASCQINFSPILAPYTFVRLKEILSDKGSGSGSSRSKESKGDVGITGQILSESGKKCIFVATSSGILPIIPSPPIYRLKIVKIEDGLVDANTQYSLLQNLEVSAYNCVGQLIGKDEKVMALLTTCKIIVPVKESPAIPKVARVPDVEYIKNLKIKSKYSDANALRAISQNEEYQRLRYDTSTLLKHNTELRAKLLKVKKSTNTVYSEKISITQKLLKEFQLKKYLKKLSLDILNDDEILSGTLRLDSLDSRRFVLRPSETILSTPEEIAAYFK